MLESLHNKSVKEKRIQTMKATWADPSRRIKWLATFNSPAYKEKHRALINRPEHRQKMLEGIKREDVKEKYRENGRRVANTPEFRARALKGAKSPKKGEKTRRNSENHGRAVHAVLRDPSGKIWHVKNVLKFVREHEHLFAPEDVAWTGPHLSQCRVARQLSNLWRRKNPQTTVKGWTLVSKTEVFYNNGEDLIERQQ